MPLTLRPPRKGKSPNYEIRGTYLGVAVERSAGTPDKKLALKVLNRIKAEIEEGKIKGGDGTTFLMALKAYLEAGGDGQFMRPIIELDGEHSLSQSPCCRHRPDPARSSRCRPLSERHAANPQSQILHASIGGVKARWYRVAHQAAKGLGR